MLFGRERNKFGPIQQPIGTGVNSLEGLNVSSGLTVQQLSGGSGFRGIAIINSGTTVATVSATHALSGAVILAQIYQYVNAQGSLSPSNVAVASVQAGQFLLQTVGSVAPTANMPVAWQIVN